MADNEVNDGSATPIALPRVPDIGSTAEFDKLVEDLQQAAYEWGLRPGSNESRFVSALLGSTRWMGRLIEASQAAQQKLFDQNRTTAELELARARELTKAANAALGQARSALIALQVERENVVVRMIEETMPMFGAKLQGALVIREKAWNDGVRFRRFLLAGALTLGLFATGYECYGWQDAELTGAFRECLSHPLHDSAGHFFCDVTRLISQSP